MLVYHYLLSIAAALLLTSVEDEKVQTCELPLAAIFGLLLLVSFILCASSVSSSRMCESRAVTPSPVHLPHPSPRVGAQE